MQVRVWIAVSEGVEAGAEEHVLCDAVRYGLGEEVFGIWAAHDEEGSGSDGVWPVQLELRALDFGQVFASEDGDGYGVFEDEWVCVVDLVRRAAHVGWGQKEKSMLPVIGRPRSGPNPTRSHRDAG